MQKKVPYVAQLGNMDCSIACMTMLFRYYGLDVDIVDVGQVVHIGRDGVNLTQLKQATQQFGFKCTAYRYNKQKNILDSNLPAVVYSGSHLAVIGSKTVLGQYILLDPIKGKSIVNFEQIHDTFSDILITIRPEKRIKRKKCKPKLKVAINYKLVAGIISLMLLIQALTLSIPLVEQALIDSITQSQSLLNSAYILVGCIVIAGLYFFLSIARQKLMLRLDISFVKEIMTKMLKKLFDIDPSFFEWHAVGEIVNRFSNVQAINNIIINTFSQVAVQIITSTICLVTMFVYSPSLSVITIAIGTIELVLLLGINKKNREDTSKYIADQSNMQGLLAEAIGNIIEIRCMGMEKAIYKNLTNQFLDELESFRKKSNTGNQMLAISSTITLIFPLIIYILGYSSVVNEALTIGQLIAYVTLANYFISPFVSIVIALPNLNFVYEVFLRYKELITYRETHKNGVIGGQQFEELYLANVSFSYNHSLNQKVLNDISLHIRPQELCAIVGFSGSGKSTLLKIILGLLSPDVGTVKINSIKANDFSHDRMYEWFSVVTQNPMCLNSSVRKNVDVTESFSDDDIWNALKVAELAVDIKSMPMGLDTFIGEQGQNISGGQRQRLAIARALLKKPQVLVFDEATSNLDPSTEKKIFENLSTMNMTKIIVTHRLSSIRMANQIIVLEKGQIVEKGTHDKLLENKGWYYKNLMKTDRRYQECLKSIGVHTKYDMRTIEILDCGDYGWEAYVEQSPCLCIKDIEEYYYRIGVILFCNYLLKAGDIHYENLIAAGAYPMVVDAENVMDNNVAPSHISAREMIFAELGESVLYSGLLPFYKFGHNGQGVDLSALNGQEGKEYPILVPALKNIKRSDMCFEYVNPITRSHSNMAMFDGKLSDPFEHKDNICEGFSDAYNYAMQNPRDVEQLIDSFSNVKVRHLVQDTQRYSMLMHASYHPDVMQDGLSRNLLLCSMFKSYKKVQRTIAVVKEEIRDLLNMDIPYFYTKASGTSLYSSRDEEIKGYFDKSSIDKAHLRLASFNNLDRDKQCRFIKMTLTHIDKQPPAETNTHKIKENKDGDYASKNDIIRAIKFIADQLLEEAVLSEDNKDANWLGVKLVGDYGHGSLSIRPLDVYLYEGVAGICIFFAAISRYYSNYELQRVLSAATKSLFDYTEDILQREGNHIDSSGVFGGESSLVYSYSLLYQLTRIPEYLKYAEKHFPIIERAVQYDQAFDVVYGNAGAILALINLYSLKRDKRYLNCAKTAAKVICDAQQKGGGWKAATVSAPLAGFSHGVAGIVYALNKLYKLYPDKHIKQCIVNGLQYEDELFCEADGNWKDIRKGSTNGKNLCAWCHGAGGILLSRISLLGNIDNETDEIVKEDIRNAVKTMQSHKYLQNPCVCHGIAGNAEILLTYGQQFQDQIASSTAKHFYSRLVGSVNSGTFECSRPYLYGFNIPGFMTGLAGIGYSLLRLLDPTLPSVLQINI